MRSKFLLCAAIAAVGASASLASPAYAADAKSKVDKNAKAKPLELHADDKAIKRQTQWEDKVMGPDSKRSELDKIARARAINEKAEKDKAERERQAAFDPPAPRAAPPKKNEKAEVSLLTAPDKSDAKPHDISPQLATEAAHKAPPPAKPADDRFIDKLLHEEDAPSKKRASTTDKELENLLAGAKETKPAGRKRGGDSVDDLLKTADKGPAMPAPRAQSGGLPEWAKQPDISPTPAPPPAPIAARPAPRRNDNDGVIHVVQGAAGNAPAIVPARTTTTVATRPGRKTAAAKAPVAWSDPFADKRPVADATPKKAAASHPSASTDTSWNDPFAEPSGDTRKTVRRAAPSVAPSAPASAPKHNDKSEPAARPANWKDPFTKAPAEPSRAPVAMRELTKTESSKWEIASRRPAAHAATSETHAAGGWAVLKKRAR